jgi:hypothetical protein
LAKPEIADAQKLVTRRNFSRTGLPSAVVSTAMTNSVLPVDVIDLDPAGEALGRVAFKHDLLQLVFDLPGGGLRHPKAMTQFDAGDDLLGSGQVIDRAKPQPQRQMRRGNDRHRKQSGTSAAALGALKA